MSIDDESFKFRLVLGWKLRIFPTNGAFIHTKHKFYKNEEIE